MGASHAPQPRTVTGAKNKMPSVNVRWKISASSPAVRINSASVTVNSGYSHDLQAGPHAHTCRRLGSVQATAMLCAQMYRSGKEVELSKGQTLGHGMKS